MAVFFDDKLGGCSCARSKCSDECSTYRSFKPRPQTNADRIRQMSDEELAEYLSNICYDFWKMFVNDPKKMWLDWLKSPVEE